MNREQKLIDLAFEIAQSSYRWHRDDDNQIESYFNEGGREDHMKWVAKQLRLCGFDTEPVGSSWGVLKE